MSASPPRSVRALPAALCGLLALVAGACGGSEGETAGTPAPAEADAAAADGASGTGATGADAGRRPGSAVTVAVEDHGLRVRLQWPATGSAHERLVITQGTHEAVLVSADHTVVLPGAVGWAPVQGLVPGLATFRVEAADDATFAGAAVAQSGSWQLAWYVAPTKASDVTVGELPSQVALGETIAISGTLGAGGARDRADIALPSEAVESADLADPGANKPFSVTRVADAAGIYVIELLAQSGVPLLNWPVWVGGVVPLAPNPLLPKPVPTLTKPVDAAALRAELLSRVNDLRARVGVGDVGIHPTVTAVAQQKSDEQVNDGYLGHVNPKNGRQMKDRFVAAGLSGTFAENIAVDYTAERCFAALYWSPSHRRNMLGAGWKTVGHGVALDDYQRLIVTQLFAGLAPR